MAGRHTARWVATGINASAYTDAFDVAESARALVSLSDARTHLNFLGVNTDNDEELRFHLDTASRVVESYVGPVARRTITETVSGSGGTLILNHAPVISLTSVTSALGYSGTYDVAGMYLDAEAGIVRYGATGLTWAYPVTVTYVAGRTIVDPRIRMAVLDLIRMNWRAQQGGGRSAFDTDAEGNEIRLGYFVPRSVRDSLSDLLMPPAVA